MDRTMPEWRRYLLVQPPAVLLKFATAMTDTILIDLIVYRTCTVTLKLNETECLILHNNNSSKEALRIDSMVQPYASQIVMGTSFMNSIFPSLLMLFLGPWSDKYGRKPVMLSGCISTSLTFVLLSVIANWDKVPWYILLAYVPIVFFGGVNISMLATTCYITDMTDDNERAWYFACLDAVIFLGALIGLLVGPVIFEACGYTGVFSVATAFCILATLYTLFFTPETVHNESSDIRKVFDFALVKDLISACIKKRDGFNRSLLWSCIACLTIIFIADQGYLAIGYLFASARLGWTVEKYNAFLAAGVVIRVFGTIFGIKLMRECAGFPETIIAMISITSAVARTLTRAFTWQPWHMYLSMLLGIFINISRPMIRVILTKAVPIQDTGKVFSVARSMETLLPFAAASMYTFLYSHYMPPIYPLPVWFLSAAFEVITIVILIYIQSRAIKRTTVSFTPLNEDDTLRS
ncbi:tetracycline resistance protein, class H isoform X2 [Monomorium pharaonis]|uniref:tetracycline resistance protein, class H isoform X2 n=1 Tax=Monomorium pharaonis TaxID=307658 RepID=UPI0017479319|nr:tetracycline resistance protein, class H isoform X2 [Monomorium pharaonis]